MSIKLPDVVPAAIRVAIQVATSGLVASNTIPAESVEGMIFIAISIVSFIWGMYKTHDRDKKLANGGS